MTRSYLALAACGALALVAGCSSTPDEGPSASASSDITTTDVIARAAQWVNAKLLYCQAPNHARDYDTACSSICTRQDNAQWDPYRSDCSGFVSWSWGLPPPGRVTGQFAPADTTVSHVIPAADLQPGDACNYPADHIILFVKWITPGTEAEFYEEPGCGVSTPYAHSFTSKVTLNGSSIYVSYEGMTFTAIRYNSIQPPNAAPKGYLDTATCDTITGWAQDPDSPKTPLTVNLTFDAPTGKSGSGTLKRLANVNRSDLCTAIGSCDQGFSVPTPLSLQDGLSHSVYAYGEDAQDSSLQLLTNAPKTFTCSPPVIPKGIKRHITDMPTMTAWQFDPLLDVAKEPLASVQALPTGTDLPTTPQAVMADDGSPEVWVIDEDNNGLPVRRHVIDASSLASWQFKATTWPVANLKAVPRGIDWPANPFVLQGMGDAAIYVMDQAPPPPNSSGTTGGGTNGGATDQAGPGGCNAGGSGGGSGWMLLVGALALVRRRR